MEEAKLSHRGTHIREDWNLGRWASCRATRLLVDFGPTSGQPRANFKSTSCGLGLTSCQHSADVGSSSDRLWVTSGRLPNLTFPQLFVQSVVNGDRSLRLRRLLVPSRQGARVQCQLIDSITLEELQTFISGLLGV